MKGRTETKFKQGLDSLFIRQRHLNPTTRRCRQIPIEGWLLLDCQADMVCGRQNRQRECSISISGASGQTGVCSATTACDQTARSSEPQGRFVYKRSRRSWRFVVGRLAFALGGGCRWRRRRDCRNFLQCVRTAGCLVCLLLCSSPDIWEYRSEPDEHGSYENAKALHNTTPSWNIPRDIIHLSTSSRQALRLRLS